MLIHAESSSSESSSSSGTYTTQKPTTKPFVIDGNWWRKRTFEPHKQPKDILVAKNVCFSSNAGDYGAFSVPYSGQLRGISLIYSSGHKRWGTHGNLFSIHITRGNELKTLYPNSNTYGYDANCHDFMYCLHHQSVHNHQLHFIDKDIKTLVEVSGGEKFRIYSKNPLNGTMCVDVMVYYYQIDDAQYKEQQRTKSSAEYISKSHAKCPSTPSFFQTQTFDSFWMQRYVP